MAQPIVPQAPVPMEITDEQVVQQPVMQPQAPIQQGAPQQMVMPEQEVAVPAALDPNAQVPDPAQQFSDQLTQVPQEVAQEDVPADPFEKYLKQADSDNVGLGQQQYQQLYDGVQAAELTLQQRISADRAAGVSPEGIRNKYALELSDLEKRKQELNQFGEELTSAAMPEQPSEVDQIVQAEQQTALEMAQQAEQAKMQAEQLALNAESRKQGQMQAKQIAQAEGQKSVNNLVEQTDQKIKETDEYVARSLPEIMRNGTFMQKLGAALAVLAGGASQGLLGLSSNPVLDQINKEVERYASAQKLKAEEKEALRKQTMEAANLAIKEKIANSTVLLNNAKVVEALSQLDAKAAEAGQKQQEMTLMQQINSGQGVSSVAAQMLPKEYRERMVSLPRSAQQVLAVNKDAANDLRSFTNEVVPALDGIDRVLEFTGSGEFSRLNPKERAQVATEIQSLVGQLRIPLTGPGVLTDTEYARLLNTIGNPNKLFSLPDWERKKLETVKSKLSSDVRSRYKNAGIELPQTPEEKMIDRMREKYPGMSAEKIKEITNRVMKR